MKPVMGGRAVDVGQRSVVVMSLFVGSGGLCWSSAPMSEQEVIQQLQKRLDEIDQEESETQNDEQQLLYLLQQRPDQQQNIEAEYAKLQQKRQSLQTERDQILTVLQDPQLLQQALQRLKQQAVSLDPTTITPEQKEIWFNTPARPAPGTGADPSAAPSGNGPEASTGASKTAASTSGQKRNKKDAEKQPTKGPGEATRSEQSAGSDFDRVAVAR